MMHNSIQANYQLLLVEDSLDDVRAMQRAFKKIDLQIPVVHCRKGEDALDYLQQHQSLPSLILLDLNLPGLQGLDVLAQIKQSADLRQIPVVIFTTSNDERDVGRCYDAGANTFIRKPMSFQGLVQVMEDLKQYWFSAASLPTRVWTQ